MIEMALQTASAIVDVALAEGTRRRYRPRCVVVLDKGGHPLVLKRQQEEQT